MIPRRGLLAGLGALLAAPAIIRTPGLLMPVKPPPIVMGMDFGREAAETLVFYSTPTGPEGSVFWRFYVEELAKRRIETVMLDPLPLLIGGKG